MIYVGKNSCYIGTFICLFPVEDEEFHIFHVGPWIGRGSEESRKESKPEFSFASHLNSSRVSSLDTAGYGNGFKHAK